MSGSGFSPLPPSSSGSSSAIIYMGGRVFTDLTNLITLVGAAGPATSDMSTFRLPGATAGYEVPAAQSLRLLAIQYRVHIVTANSRFNLVYSDNDVGMDTNTNHTNAVLYGGAYPAAGFPVNTIGIFEGALNFLIPTGKFPGVIGNGGTTEVGMILYGYLE